MFSVLYVLNACGDDLKSQFIWDVNFKHAPLEKVPNLRHLLMIKLKFYVLYFSVWGDLWPYSNAYVRPGTRAKTFWSLNGIYSVVCCINVTLIEFFTR